MSTAGPVQVKCRCCLWQGQVETTSERCRGCGEHELEVVGRTAQRPSEPHRVFEFEGD